MTSSQWIGIAILLLLVGGLLYAFMRGGSKVKPDGAHDSGSAADWGGHGGHGGADSGGH